MPAESLRVWHYSRDSASKVKWLFRCHACSLKIVSATQRQRFGSLVFCQSVDENVTAPVHADSKMAAVTQTDPKTKRQVRYGSRWLGSSDRAGLVPSHGTTSHVASVCSGTISHQDTADGTRPIPHPPSPAKPSPPPIPDACPEARCLPLSESEVSEMLT